MEYAPNVTQLETSFSSTELAFNVPSRTVSNVKPKFDARHVIKAETFSSIMDYVTHVELMDVRIVQT